MADENIVIKIEFQAEDGTVKTAFAKVEAEADKAGKSIGDKLGKSATGETSKLNSALGSLSKAFIGVAAGVFAFNGIKNAIGGAVSEAREGQDALNRLSSALAQNGAFSQAAVTGFSNYADQLSRITGIDDDLIIKNGALLSSLTGLTGQGLERATKAALDLAQATGKDLGTATQLLSRASNGGADALKKYGIIIDENTPKSEKFSAVLAQIEKRFGGVAETRLNTFSGQVENLGNAFGDLQKVFGNLIVESPAVRAVLQVTANLIRGLADNLKEAFKGDIIGSFIKNVLTLGQSITNYVIRPLEIGFNFIKTGLLAVSTGILALAQPLIGMQKLIIDNLVLPFINFVLPIIGKVAGFFREDFGKAIDDLSVMINDKLPKATAAAGDLAGQAYQQSLSSLVQSSNDVLNTSVADGTNNLISKYQSAVDQMGTINTNFRNNQAILQEETKTNFITFGETLTALNQGFTEEINNVNQNAQKNFQQIGAAMFKTLGTGAGQAFAAFGAAVKKGEKPLDAFANAMLAAFGQAFVQLGTGYLLQGIAAVWAGDPRGPGLISAGAALAAFGGILSALGGGGVPSAGAAGAGGTPTGANSSPNGETEDLNQLALQQPRSQVVLNVNGDVLDSNETGVRLTEILRDFSDKNGNTEVLT